MGFFFFGKKEDKPENEPKIDFKNLSGASLDKLAEEIVQRRSETNYKGIYWEEIFTAVFDENSVAVNESSYLKLSYKLIEKLPQLKSRVEKEFEDSKFKGDDHDTMADNTFLLLHKKGEVASRYEAAIKAAVQDFVTDSLVVLEGKKGSPQTLTLTPIGIKVRERLTRS